ncbi:nuclear elongation and deformation protein 1 [Massarina eburnea CBS 473.64]|uniref:Nuclear elongation and deformation protein 1 n=1 Tax=Massarina eburnea CBS 473.64 TaxID=1395130 RepID=A0A6A6RSA7_9PLEO|nr:nuclear elongation and deformation protein 1 [Massarina eburnea CBS 473.64]
MNYVRSLTGTVSKGWNSINPATLSGAIDVIVVEQEDGSLACSPFHVRFGKYQILRPSDKKVQFTVNDEKQDYAMKLGEGGEAFFVFSTSSEIPEEMQTSPLASPASSPEQKPVERANTTLGEPDLLSLDGTSTRRRTITAGSKRPGFTMERPKSGDWSGVPLRAQSEETLPTATHSQFAHEFEQEAEEKEAKEHGPIRISRDEATAWNLPKRATSPPPLLPEEAMARAIALSKKLFTSNIPNKVTESGDLMLDMTGYKSSDDEALRAEVVARKVLADEVEGNYDIGALIGADENGNLWIYSSEEAKMAALQKSGISVLNDEAMRSADAVSDPGYHSDDNRSDTTEPFPLHMRRDSDSAVGLATPPDSPNAIGGETRSYAKTLRLTSDQLKALDLKPGANTMSFTVNRSTCTANMFYWQHDVPIVISDIDGTITKSDALGHVLNYIGRDWTHQGVAKLYTDIVNNGYNIFYLTSRSVGQADMTRAYLNGVVQDNYRLPRGPVIMSPDRTIAALRREIYLRKPEVFKMACLRDIMNLFGKPAGQTPFYAGFGNRFTDALSYRSVNIPSTRIFTINSNAEVSLDVLSLNSYKTGYASMREIVDHFFPPVGLLVPPGGEDFTDFNFWRERPLDIDDFTDSEDGEDGDDDDVLEAGSVRSEDEGSEVGEDLEASYMTQDSIDHGVGMELDGSTILETIEGGRMEVGEDEGDDYEDEEYEDEDEDEEYSEEDEDGDEEMGDDGVSRAYTPTRELDGLKEKLEELKLRQGRSPTPQPPSPERRLREMTEG